MPRMSGRVAKLANLLATDSGEMRGKGRPKFSPRGGFARAYTDTKTASAETWVKACAVEQVGQPMLSGPLAITLSIGVTVPRSWPKKRQAAALNGDQGLWGGPARVAND